MTTVTASKTKWVETKIGDTCTVGDGAHAKIKRQAAGIIYLTSKNIKHEKLSLVNIDYISEEDFKKYFRKNSKVIKSPQIDDVLLCIIGASMGDSCFVKVKKTFGLSSSVAILRANQSILFPKYLYYWTRGYIFQDALYGIKGGAAQGYASQEMIKSLPLNYPPLPTQCKIAAILSAYDDLIENNTRRIEILEEMARSIYREWFVKFRFPGHEQVQMVESELGLIPEGWEVKPLSDVCSRITDGSHWSPKTVDQGYPMASVKDMHNWGFHIEKCRKISPEDYENLVKNHCKPLKNDVLIAKDGSYLKHIFVIEKELDMVILSSIALLRPNEKIISHILSLYLLEPSIKSRMAGYVSGVAIPRIILKDFRKFLIVVPPIDFQKKFFSLAEPMIINSYRLIDKNINLRQTRDLLLPRLISGEIDVENLDINTGPIAA